jgi:transposase InsO family protein
VLDGRPISHVAAEAGISRPTVAKWVGRYRELGVAGLLDESSRPERSPMAISEDIVDAILELRRTEKWGAARIAAHLATVGIDVSASTVHRTLQRNDLSRVKDMDPPTGELARAIRYEHPHAGSMVHVDVKKVGRIPKGGGWAVHGRGTPEALASKRVAARKGEKVGMAYLHSAVDDYSRVAYTEVLDDEKGTTAAAWWLRAVAYLGTFGIVHVERCLTDNGSCYRSRAWRDALYDTGTVHKRTRPYTPRTNGKVERYNGTMVKEWLRRRAYESEQDRTEALADFLNYYNFERNHSALGWFPPVTRTPLRGDLAVPQVNEAELVVPPTEAQSTIFDFL